MAPIDGQPHRAIASELTEHVVVNSFNPGCASQGEAGMGRPKRTASAPNAKAFTMSVPRLMPPSTKFCARPSMARATRGSAFAVGTAVSIVDHHDSKQRRPLHHGRQHEPSSARTRPFTTIGKRVDWASHSSAHVSWGQRRRTYWLTLSLPSCSRAEGRHGSSGGGHPPWVKAIALILFTGPDFGGIHCRTRALYPAACPLNQCTVTARSR